MTIVQDAICAERCSDSTSKIRGYRSVIYAQGGVKWRQVVNLITTAKKKWASLTIVNGNRTVNAGDHRLWVRHLTVQGLRCRSYGTLLTLSVQLMLQSNRNKNVPPSKGATVFQLGPANQVKKSDQGYKFTYIKGNSHRSSPLFYWSSNIYLQWQHQSSDYP